MSVLYADPALLWSRVLDRIEVAANGCWLWRGAVTSKGYGSIGAGRRSKTVTTHRLAVIVRDGRIAAGMTVDHLCHNRSNCTATGKDCLHRRCANPAHLDVCASGLNQRRGKSRALFCGQGHELEFRWDRATQRLLRLCECLDLSALPRAG